MTVRIKSHVPEYLAFAENAVEKAIARGAIRVQREARRLVSRFPSPPPSLPGEPPHLETGTLARSIDQETFRRKGEFIGRIGTNLKYGLHLELGTRNMAMRPYLRPALDRERKVIVKEIRRAMRRGR